MGGYKTWTALEEVKAADMNTFVRDNTVPQFANSAARSSAIPSPVVGTASYLADTGSYEVYYGATTGWRPVWRDPWGLILFQTYTTQQTANFTQTYAVNIVKDRRYMVTLTAQFKNTADACGVNYNTVFDGASGGTFTALVPGANREGVANAVNIFVASATKSANVGFNVSVANGGTFTWNPAGFGSTCFSITDIGPGVGTAAPTS